MRRKVRCAAAIALSFAAVSPALADRLPDAASSLSERYQDWQVICAGGEANPRCVMTQRRSDPRTRQMVIAIELRTAGDEGVSGALLLPFGLSLKEGVVVQVDGGSPTPALAFSTCLPTGCLVPLTYDRGMLNALRSGVMLKVTASASGTAETVSLALSLQGFSSAYSRLRELEN